jgi:hypothetical protein
MHLEEQRHEKNPGRNKKKESERHTEEERTNN